MALNASLGLREQNLFQLSMKMGDGIVPCSYDCPETTQNEMAFGEVSWQNLLLLSNISNSSQFSMDAMRHIIWQLRANHTKGEFEVFVDKITMYVIPVIIICGLCGNVMSALVFTCTHLRRLSSSLYLTWLALADIGFLVALGIAWMDRMGVHWLTTIGCCQVVVYLTRVMGCLSVWSVLSFTAERYVIVYVPLRKDELCTRHRAKVIVASLSLGTMLMYSYIFWSYDVISLGPRTTCAPVPKYQDLITVMTSIDTIIACVVPSLTIVILNIKIIYKLHQFQHYQLNNMESSSTKSTSQQPLTPRSITTQCAVKLNFYNPEVHSRSHVTKVTRGQVKLSTGTGSSQLRTARMLLVLSSVFVLLNLPSHVFRVQAFIHHVFWHNAKTPRAQYKVHELFEILFFLNFAINFFIYSACGQQFRTEMKRLCQRFRYYVSENSREILLKLRVPAETGAELQQIAVGL